MYIDVVPNRNSPPAVLLRESVRDGRRTLKRTIANLSTLPEEAVAALRVVLRGDRLVEGGEHFAVTRSLPCGHVRAVKLAMRRLGMAELVGSKPGPARQAALAMNAQRIVRPGSKTVVPSPCAPTRATRPIRPPSPTRSRRCAASSAWDAS